jgi:hypothetical protein
MEVGLMKKSDVVKEVVVALLPVIAKILKK